KVFNKVGQPACLPPIRSAAGVCSRHLVSATEGSGAQTCAGALSAIERNQIMIERATLGVWFRPKVVRFEHLLDAEEQQAVRRLRAKVTNFIGHSRHGCVNCNAMAGSPSPNGAIQDAGQFLWIIAKRLFCCISLPRTRIRYDRLPQALRISD